MNAINAEITDVTPWARYKIESPIQINQETVYFRSIFPIYGPNPGVNCPFCNIFADNQQNNASNPEITDVTPWGISKYEFLIQIYQ